MKPALFFAATGLLLAAPQSDEVRVSWRPYTPPQLKITVPVDLVQLEVVVRDAKGKPVGGLKQTDFAIFDEGKAREISVFSVEIHSAAGGSTQAAHAVPGSTAATATAARRSTMLVFDDLHATPGELQRTKIAAKAFVKAGLGDNARAAVFATSQGLLQDFTTDTSAIDTAIDRLRSHEHLSEAGLQPCPHISPYTAYLIDTAFDRNAINSAVAEAKLCAPADESMSVYTRTRTAGPTAMSGDPITAAVLAQASQTWQQARVDSLHSFDALNAAVQLLAKQPGTRVLLLASTGFLSGALPAERDAVQDRAVRSSVVINSIDAKGLWTDTPGRESRAVNGLPVETYAFEASHVGAQADAQNEVMQEFASATGGLFFHNSNDLAGGFSELGAVPETTYLMGFRPDPDNPQAKYRKLKVRLTGRNGDFVQTRPGYMPAAPVAASDPAVGPRRLDTELQSTGTLDQIPVKLAGDVTATKDGPALSLVIQVDIGKLNFANRDGRHAQRLTFVGALIDSGGRIVSAKEAAMDFNLKDETLAKLVASGVRATLGLPAPAGQYTVRVVVQDADGKLAAQSQKVAIGR